MRTKHENGTAFNDRSELAGHRSFVLVGIGGAGMSGVARMLHNRGFAVKGTDLTDSSLIEGLRELGIEVWIGHTAEVVADGDAVVFSDAIPLETSPEYSRAKELGCPVFRRSQCLGWMLEGKKTIAVTGTHGKTTVTGMIGAGLRAAGLDPTIVVGAEVPQFGGSVIDGEGEWAVVEACEAYDSFHDFDPTIVVLTNLEMDHADYHGTWEDLRDSVLRFVERLPDDGVLVYCKEDEGAVEIAGSFDGELRGYDKQMAQNIGHPEVHKTGLQEIPGAPRQAQGTDGDYVTRTMPLLLFGEHNWTNASGALRAIIEATRMSGEKEALGTVAAVQAAVITFRGADRRLQSFPVGEIDVVDDYAHHPTEIKASIQALREKYPDRRLIVVFQPHLYSRTADLIPEFAAALDRADHVFLTDIFPAREDPIPGISSLRIAELMISPVTYVPSRHLLPRMVNAFVQTGDVVVGMGAGNISEFAPAMIKEMQRPEKAKIAVVFGGDSVEREVSILSGREVHAALTELGYDSSLLDATELLLNGDLSALQGDERPDLAFLCVHGTNAEDGSIQGLFELLHIPYTGSGILASAIAMDKSLTKTILQERGIAVPAGVLLERNSDQPEEMPAPPVIVKPNAQGSTVGLSFVERQDQLDEAIELAFRYDDRVLVEEWVRGIEVSVPVAGDTALPVVEIVPASGRYDFESKYTPGATEEICPARISEAQTEEAQRLALESHDVLGCKGVTRTDMIVAKDRIVVLEVNSLPGFTSTSLVPRSADVHGWSFQELVNWMVRDAIKIEEAPRSR